MSKKVSKWIDMGLQVTYAPNYTAIAQRAGIYYDISFYKGEGLPAHEVREYSTEEDVTQAMRQIAPLRYWGMRRINDGE